MSTLQAVWLGWSRQRASQLARDLKAMLLLVMAAN
jgi:hypothetical protein